MAQDPDPKSIPTVVGGKLTHPYPINSMADVHRARVLPPPRMPKTAAAPRAKAAAKAAAPSAPARSPGAEEQPVSGFDYVRRRNQLQREVSGGRSVSGKR